MYSMNHCNTNWKENSTYFVPNELNKSFKVILFLLPLVMAESAKQDESCFSAGGVLDMVTTRDSFGDYASCVFAVSGAIICLVAIFGTISNLMSIFIFSRPSMRTPIHCILLGT